MSNSRTTKTHTRACAQLPNPPPPPHGAVYSALQPEWVPERADAEQRCLNRDQKCHLQTGKSLSWISRTRSRPRPARQSTGPIRTAVYQRTSGRSRRQKLPVTHKTSRPLKKRQGRGKKGARDSLPGTAAASSETFRCCAHFRSKLFYFGEQMLGDLGPLKKRTWGGLRGANI